MKWLLLPAAAMLSLASFAFAATQDWKGDTSYASPGHSLKSARESLESGYYAGAVADLASLVRRVPPDAEVYFLLGAAHWGNGNPEEAHKALETALAVYDGALAIVTHDRDFMDNVGVDREVRLARPLP